MAYIGVSPSNGVRQKHTYTATASQTTFSGAGSEGISLSYRDSNYVDVYVNGVKLGDADYTATSGTSIVLGVGAAVNDIVEIITYDVFSVADTVSKADGGTFDGNVSFADNTKAIFGAGNDLQIFHNGGNSLIQDTGVGQLYLQGSASVRLTSVGGAENYATFNENGAVNLYYDNSLKLATTSTGIDVTGGVTTDAYSYLDGLRISGTDTGNTVYQQSGDLSISSASGSISLKPSGANILHATNTSVGIGTTSPSAKVHIKTASEALRLETTDATGDNYIHFEDPSGAKGFLGYVASSSDNFHIQNQENSDMLFFTNASERMRIDSSGNILAGTSTAIGGAGGTGAQLFLKQSSNSNGIASVANSNDNYVRMLHTGTIGKVEATYGTGSYTPLTLFTSGTERMRIDTSGNLLVGKSALNATDVGIVANASGRLWATASGSSSIFNRTTSDGTIIDLRKDGTTVGSIGVNTKLYIGGSGETHTTGVSFQGSGTSTNRNISPSDGSGALVDGAINLGSSSYRWNSLWLSGGVYLGGTGSANLLDDYEEGTFTATAWGGGSISSQVCKYTKVGNLVTFIARVIYNTTSNNDGAGFNGLPFTSGSADSNRGGIPSYANYGASFYALVGSASTRVIFYNLNGGTLLNSNFSGKQVFISGHYYI
jgi:hypothetical protein